MVGGKVRSAHGDRSRLVALSPCHIQSQDAVLAFRVDLVGVDLYRKCDRTIEAAGEALATMQARTLTILYRFGPTDPDRVPLHLNLQIRFFDAWNFRYDDQIIALSEDV